MGVKCFFPLTPYLSISLNGFKGIFGLELYDTEEYLLVALTLECLTRTLSPLSVHPTYIDEGAMIFVSIPTHISKSTIRYEFP